MNPQGNSAEQSNSDNVANHENEVMPLPLFPLAAEGESSNASPATENPSNGVDLLLNLRISETEQRATRSPGNAPSIMYHFHQVSDQVGSSTSSTPHIRLVADFYGEGNGEMNSSGSIQNHDNQVQYELSRPLPPYPSAEVSRRLPYHIQTILQALQNSGRSTLTFEELMVLENNILIEEENNREPVEELQVGLSVETITQHLRSEIFVSDVLDGKEKCPICQDEFEDGSVIGELHQCEHKFHVDCIKLWLVRKNNCPVCLRTALEINEW